MAGGLLLPMEPPRRAASQQQLQFSLKAPSVAENLSARFASPLPIVIEKLKKPAEEAALCGGDSGGPAPLSFSAVSEETLRRAVRLARRDLKRRPKPEEDEAGLPGHPRSKALGKAGPVRASSRSQRETTDTGAKVYISKPTRVKAEPLLPDSPPTRDPGLVPFATKAEAKKEKDEEERSAQEVRRLQKELQGYIRKVEVLAQKERSQTSLDPEERRRARIWGQEQAARSARTLYVLRQQVKEIQDDLEKLGPHQVRHTKKSKAMARLAAAHRGASRALQAWLSHWTLDQPEDEEEEEDHRLGLRWDHCRELGQLLRQLSLCSVQMEVQGPSSTSSPPDALLDLMLQIEDLDSLLARKAPLGVRAADPPPAGPPSKGRPSLRCPRKEKAVQKRPVSRKLPPSLTPGPPSRPLPVGEPPETGEPPESGEGAVEAEEPPKVPPKARPVIVRPKGSALLQSRPQGGPCKRKNFREPTLSFRLKEAKPPLKGEGRPPWVPPSTASPPRSAAQVKAAEKKVEQAVLEPLLQRVQKVSLSLEKEPQEVRSGRQASTPDREEGSKGDGDPKGGPPWQQDKQEEGMDARLDLVEMLQRMQEIERSQEAVRRRYHQLVYSDVEFCAQEKKNWEGPPPPIQVTQALSRKEEPQVDIVLERPSDTNAVEEEEEEEEAVRPCMGENGPPMGPNGAFLSVPQNVLQSIADYGARYRRHLRLMAHEAVGRFDPWRIAESLAEELTESALEEVAAELQGLCEDCAEALFVSEFLQPPVANQ
ncbi:protein moonraker isoform X1 [Anolis sagrei]|uniref:protein moonraker isoform X1 n=1 Tax=Anolis sagrei TaxID=38937 RepID=UPI00352294FE